MHQVSEETVSHMLPCLVWPAATILLRMLPTATSGFWRWAALAGSHWHVKAKPARPENEKLSAGLGLAPRRRRLLVPRSFSFTPLGEQDGVVF